MKYSVVIPAHNEAGSIEATVRGLALELDREGIPYEILVVDDSSTDGTAAAVHGLERENARVRYVRSHHGRGFGFTVRAGLERFTGDAVAIVMADGSDDPRDVV